jgi:hypothetical protein
MMGDSESDYFDDETFAPQILYYDDQEQEFTDEESLEKQGVKLISYEYPTPIENSFVFSHLSYFSGEIVLPLVLIALLALLAIIIFVKKEKELKYKPVDIISIVLNFIICLIILPFTTVVAMFIDINGGNPAFYHQLLYFVPTIMVLCVAASIALRRKGYGVKTIITELAGPAIFAIHLIICGAFGLL